VKNRKLKPVVKRLLCAILFMILGIAIYQLFTIHTDYKTYSCDGGIIQLCGVRR
jgi:NADH:ubiquinone oxidoreductase subunit 3 (subunit A)